MVGQTILSVINFKGLTMKKSLILFLILGIITPSALISQTMSKKDLKEGVRQYRIEHEHEIFQELVDFLSIPNNADDLLNIRRNAELIKSMMEKRGINAQVMETGGSPLVYGEITVPGATKTIMFYAHFDGQAIDPSKWIDQEAFTPVLRPGKMEAGETGPKPIPFPKADERFMDDWRIYARSASDDKSPITAVLTAMDALKSIDVSFGSNVRFIFEGEEGNAGCGAWALTADHHADVVELVSMLAIVNTGRFVDAS